MVQLLSALKSLVKRMIDDAQNCITEKYSISNRFSPQQNNCTYIGTSLTCNQSTIVYLLCAPKMRENVVGIEMKRQK